MIQTQELSYICTLDLISKLFQSKLEPLVGKQ